MRESVYMDTWLANLPIYPTTYLPTHLPTDYWVVSTAGHWPLTTTNY